MLVPSTRGHPAAAKRVYPVKMISVYYSTGCALRLYGVACMIPLGACVSTYPHEQRILSLLPNVGAALRRDLHRINHKISRDKPAPTLDYELS